MLEFELLEAEALHLPQAERARLAHSLLCSLDTPCGPEIDKAWLDEAERRAGEIDKGEVELIPGDEVSRKARALLL